MSIGRNYADDPRCDEDWWYGGSASSVFDRINERDPEDDNYYDREN